MARMVASSKSSYSRIYSHKPNRRPEVYTPVSFLSRPHGGASEESANRRRCQPPGDSVAEEAFLSLLAHDEARGWIKVGFVGTAEFLNPSGRVQGGILAAMLDDTWVPRC